MKGDDEKLLEWIERIKGSDKLIVVEGKEDKAALRRIGITNVVQLNRKPLYKVVEEVVETGKEVIILTDLDKKGKQLYGKLSHDLRRFGVRVDDRFRNFLFRHTQLRQIEGIDSYVGKRGLKVEGKDGKGEGGIKNRPFVKADSGMEDEEIDNLLMG